MNDTLDSSLEENFNAAMKLSTENQDYDALISLLCSDKIVEKQIAVLKLETIKSTSDANILVSNLVGQDGKIREAVVFKINDLMLNEDYKNLFLSESNFKILLQGIMDINGNVCRQIVNLTKVSEFSQYLCQNLPDEIAKTLNNIEKIDAESKQYVISKRNFQLYWCLEALYNIACEMDINKIKAILEKAGDFEDYTIREKTSKILSKLDNPVFEELKQKLKSDENYYVRRYLI